MKCHLFVCKDDTPIAVQNGLEGEGSQTDVVLEGNPVPLNHQRRAYAVDTHHHHTHVVCVCVYIYITLTLYIYIYIHYRSKVWGHPDNFVSSMKTHFYLSNELKIE